MAAARYGGARLSCPGGPGAGLAYAPGWVAVCSVLGLNKLEKKKEKTETELNPDEFLNRKFKQKHNWISTKNLHLKGQYFF